MARSPHLNKNIHLIPVPDSPESAQEEQTLNDQVRDDEGVFRHGQGGDSAKLGRRLKGEGQGDHGSV